MCIITGYVNYVKRSKISYIKSGIYQTTILEYSINNRTLDNLLIIPLPNPKTVIFHDTKHDVLDDAFPNITLVMSINELSEYEISEEILLLLRQYKNYGFIICELIVNDHTYRPLIYSHKINKKIFIPVQHYVLKLVNNMVLREEFVEQNEINYELT